MPRHVSTIGVGVGVTAGVGVVSGVSGLGVPCGVSNARTSNTPTIIPRLIALQNTKAS